jgi:hypothetical protein
LIDPFVCAERFDFASVSKFQGSLPSLESNDRFSRFSLFLLSVLAIPGRDKSSLPFLIFQSVPPAVAVRAGVLLKSLDQSNTCFYLERIVKGTVAAEPLMRLLARRSG